MVRYHDSRRMKALLRMRYLMRWLTVLAWFVAGDLVVLGIWAVIGVGNSIPVPKDGPGIGVVLAVVGTVFLILFACALLPFSVSEIRAVYVRRRSPLAWRLLSHSSFVAWLQGMDKPLPVERKGRRPDSERPITGRITAWKAGAVLAPIEAELIVSLSSPRDPAEVIRWNSKDRGQLLAFLQTKAQLTSPAAKDGVNVEDIYDWLDLVAGTFVFGVDLSPAEEPILKSIRSELSSILSQRRARKVLGLGFWRSSIGAPFLTTLIFAAMTVVGLLYLLFAANATAAQGAFTLLLPAAATLWSGIFAVRRTRSLPLDRS